MSLESAVLATVNTPVLRPNIEEMANFGQYVEDLDRKGIYFAKVSSFQNRSVVIAGKVCCVKKIQASTIFNELNIKRFISLERFFQEMTEYNAANS